jgi:hypothetical protein
MTRMKKVIGFAMVLLLVFAVGAADAQEIQGKIKAVNGAERVLTLEDGTRLWVAEGLRMDAAKEGASVKASFQERDGKKVATTLQISQ